jgi:hypothetical protein
MFTTCDNPTFGKAQGIDKVWWCSWVQRALTDKKARKKENQGCATTPI